MHALKKQSVPLAALALFALVASCGSSSGEQPGQDSSPPPDSPSTKVDLPVVADGPPPADAPSTADIAVAGLDAGVSTETAVEVGATGDDGAAPQGEVATARTDGATSEVGDLDSLASNPDGGAPALDSGTAVSDGALDVAPDGFVPAPAVPIVVNSGDTGVYNQADGTWKVFYFDAVAGQLYCISDLSGAVRGYVGTSPAVSPESYQFVTGAEGTLAFTATAAQRYYIAVAASGGGQSGYFQVADGGQLLALGANALTLAAPNLDDTYFFRFPISAGHGYSITATGPSTPAVGLSVSAFAERASNGQFSKGLWSTSGPLPITNEAIPATSVDQSYSGFYYFFIRVTAAMSLTVTLVQTS